MLRSLFFGGWANVLNDLNDFKALKDLNVTLFQQKTPPESSGGVSKATEAAPHPNLYLYYPK